MSSSSRNQCGVSQSPASSVGQGPTETSASDTSTTAATNTNSASTTRSVIATNATSTALSQKVISEATVLESHRLFTKGTDCSVGPSQSSGSGSGFGTGVGTGVGVATGAGVVGGIVSSPVVGAVNEGIIFGKRIPGSSCAERQLDGDQSSSTCCHHQKKITQPPLKFDDEFEEYRARANSGGSLFGLLRRQQNICEDEEEPIPPNKGRPKRQRSKSLVPNPDSTLKLFPGGRRRPTSPCQCMDNTYLISPKPPRHPRRFSAACVDARDVISKHNITVSISPPPGSPHSTDSSWIGEIDEELSQIEELPDSLPETPSRPSSWVTPRTSPRVSPRGSPAGGTPEPGTSMMEGAQDLLKPPGPFPLPCGKTVDDLRQTVYRRRSFCITSKGIINEGDFFVDKLANTVIDASSIGSDLDLELGADRSRASSFNSQGSALWSGASSDTQCHRVLVLGAAGVGKTSLTQQFCTSEYMGAQNTSFGKCGNMFRISHCFFLIQLCQVCFKIYKTLQHFSGNFFIIRLITL